MWDRFFGGTGASAIHPLVRYLRSLGAAANGSSNLKVGAVAIAPYFQFRANADDPEITPKDIQEAAHSEDFPLISRSAAEYYEHLQQIKDWDFDAMYWVGDDTPMDVKFSIGGVKQKNPAHFVDLLAALACLDFFSNAPRESAPAAGFSLREGATMAPRRCWYAGPEVPPESGRNLLTWDDLPIRNTLFGNSREEVRKQLHTFQFAAVAHRHPCSPVRCERKSWR